MIVLVGVSQGVEWLVLLGMIAVVLVVVGALLRRRK